MHRLRWYMEWLDLLVPILECRMVFQTQCYFRRSQCFRPLRYPVLVSILGIVLMRPQAISRYADCAKAMELAKREESDQQAVQALVKGWHGAFPYLYELICAGQNWNS
jgi:hypothetical protein